MRRVLSIFGLVAGLVFASVSSAVDVQPDSHVTHPTMGAAMSFFHRLTDTDALPLTKSKVEAISNTSLVEPNRDYPPDVLKLLAEQGIPRPGRARYVKSTMPVNDDLFLNIHFASPVASITFGSTQKNIPPFPTPLTQEALAEYTKAISADFEERVVKHCIDKNKNFQLLADNGWKHVKQPLTADLTEEDGNFQFTRLNEYTMATLNEGCLVQLTVGTPKSAP